jgi:hypothetical protein
MTDEREKVPQHLKGVIESYQRYLDEKDIDKAIREEREYEEKMELLESALEEIIDKLYEGKISRKKFQKKLDKMIKKLKKKYPQETILAEELEEMKELHIKYLREWSMDKKC